MSFHINPKTGHVSQCRATKDNCPFGTVEEHHSTKEAARQAYEAAQPDTLSPAQKRKQAISEGNARASALKYKSALPGTSVGFKELKAGDEVVHYVWGDNGEYELWRGVLETKGENSSEWYGSSRTHEVRKYDGTLVSSEVNERADGTLTLIAAWHGTEKNHSIKRLAENAMTPAEQKAHDYAVAKYGENYATLEFDELRIGRLKQKKFDALVRSATQIREMEFTHEGVVKRAAGVTYLNPRFLGSEKDAKELEESFKTLQ